MNGDGVVDFFDIDAFNNVVQRLLRDLDEYPLPDAGYRMLEPPHRRRTLAARPCPPRRVGRLSPIAAVIATQGWCPLNELHLRAGGAICDAGGHEQVR
jgi:hypothetical protein